jgi:hypothetical protein
VGPRAVLDAVVKRNISSHRRESNPRTPIVQPVAQRYTDEAITALPRMGGPEMDTKPDGRKETLGRSRLRWEVSIRMHLREMV